MNPTDALPEDWRMYYNGAWMRHIRHGPGMVHVSGDELYFYRYPNDVQERQPIKVKGGLLECWWPRSGSYNTPDGAIYIVRVATRSMRKSAHPNEHYRVTWSSSKNTVYGHEGIMLCLRRGCTFVDFKFAKECLSNGVTRSVALSQDLILSKEDNHIKVIFRGLDVGYLGLDYKKFVAYFPEAHITKRAVARLTQEGVL